MLQLVTRQISVACKWSAEERKYERTMGGGSAGSHTHFLISQTKIARIVKLSKIQQIYTEQEYIFFNCLSHK
jgi:hypothetical protein